jgi:hypothetical protein
VLGSGVKSDPRLTQQPNGPGLDLVFIYCIKYVGEGRIGVSIVE